MAKLILNEAQTEQYLAEPSIKCDEKYEFDEELLKELHCNSYSGRAEEDVIGHVAKIFKVLDPIKVDSLDPFRLRMITFLLSLSRNEKMVDERGRWKNQHLGRVDDEEGLDPLEFIIRRNSKFKDHKKVDKTTKRALLYSWIEVGNNEGVIDEDISSNDDRDQTNLSMLTKPKIKIGDEFLKILHDKSFNGMDGSDINEHIGKVLEITKWIKIRNVDKNELRLHVFSKSLSGDAKKWWDNEGVATTWKELCDKFFHKCYPLSHVYKSNIPDGWVMKQITLNFYTGWHQNLTTTGN
uniref:Reverse transcriptase domain-containing protein n=1 Tax=Tanacetum cinerariifolium TaxID=118510 RepID=A0A699IDB1_TANCI|nr:hypothetical protein [Tanacetum cinerariifolium]